VKTTLFVNYSESHVSGGEICAGQENYSWPSYETEYQSYDVESITLKNVSPYHEEIIHDLPDPKPNGLWVVVARYSDGGTFGSTSGYGSIEGVYDTRKEAQARADELEKGGSSRKGYTPWTGYFSDFEGVEIHLVPLVTE
jgi:hypothetical protein